ncbi:MAG: hypothetical protein K6F71_09130 [Ruminococcus sp.]|uniref:hypothetical protein n=1 Tax=Ruminococcus sp. TaxID=41978 RepID=UPI0025E0D634|nr:hypothetical protein [Ruminococcus sp.]MCR5540960.1 hypothetical protein [Ruminococcus sp.]
MQLEITRELLPYTCGYTAKLDVNDKYPLGMKVIYEPTAYLFDAETFLICDKDSDESDYLCDTIPFPIVNQHEAMHAFVDSINNKRITNLFRYLPDEDFGKVFWGVFDDGGENFCAYHRFEEKYRYNIIIKWCEDNNIPYYIKDPDILKVLEYRPY